MIEAYNTLTGKKEALPKTDGKPLKLFVCGPTVYDYPHIGNARTFMAFDIFVRFLRSRKAKLFYLQNITDIDDKIINRAKEQKKTWKEIARTYEKVFFKYLKDLNISSVDKFARATDHIPEIVRQVKTLIAKKHAYLIENDGYYFDLSTFPDYGKLARRTAEQAEDGVSRIDVSDKKRNRGDFCLWKFSGKDEPGWKTELGFGRPGWHIEDTAITEHFFGPQYDIHGGALDLKFPHHEAEIAQQESASGKKPFVKHWMHVGFLTVNGEKMSKSLNNFVTVENLLKEHSADAFRMSVLMHHYRSPMDWNEKVISDAAKNFSDILSFVGRLDLVIKKRSGFRDGAGKTFADKLSETETSFIRAMSDDFNSPAALAAVFSYMSTVQPYLWNLSARDAKLIKKTFTALFSSVGLVLKPPKIPRKAKLLALKREKYRSSLQFAQADALRKELDTLGFIVEDTPLGPFIWPKRMN